MSNKTRARLYEFCAVRGQDLMCVVWVMRFKVWCERCLWQWSVSKCEAFSGRGEISGSRSQAVGFRWHARGDRAELKGLWCRAIGEVSREGCQVWDVWRQVQGQKSEVWGGEYNIFYTSHRTYSTLFPELHAPSYISHCTPCITFSTLYKTVSQSIRLLLMSTCVVAGGRCEQVSVRGEVGKRKWDLWECMCGVICAVSCVRGEEWLGIVDKGDVRREVSRVTFWSVSCNTWGVSWEWEVVIWGLDTGFQFCPANLKWAFHHVDLLFLWSCLPRVVYSNHINASCSPDMV